MRMNTSLINKVEQMAKEQNRNFTNMVETLLMKAVSE
ncbi:hypothetical protein Oweho_3188 [Owenweeksia hongkongensis DSM 17368]|uniref:CopG-like ribbon-helix-helix domain-containing protein n=1 Tax=Owenweeksia hongkongensis (strain DSM 17368 / CIP 108786 / JCM 12287 / NRRL B-23963 / UST20020801) TaxID=926562 RepID=G8R3Q2_OWEHD|nr:hypothetical protein Oweho_3188 [Owenweeksia hongkongensis DSM 17368]